MQILLQRGYDNTSNGLLNVTDTQTTSFFFEFNKRTICVRPMCYEQAFMFSISVLHKADKQALS